jgi:hypothetical protein
VGRDLIKSLLDLDSARPPGGGLDIWETLLLPMPVCSAAFAAWPQCHLVLSEKGGPTREGEEGTFWPFVPRRYRGGGFLRKSREGAGCYHEDALGGSTEWPLEGYQFYPHSHSRFHVVFCRRFRTSLFFDGARSIFRVQDGSYSFSGFAFGVVFLIVVLTVESLHEEEGKGGAGGQGSGGGPFIGIFVKSDEMPSMSNAGVTLGTLGSADLGKGAANSGPDGNAVKSYLDG